jgi:hypothetical protein
MSYKFQLYLKADVERFTKQKMDCLDGTDVISFREFKKTQDREIVVEPLSNGKYRCWDLKALVVWFGMPQAKDKDGNLKIPISNIKVSEDTLTLLYKLLEALEKENPPGFVKTLMESVVPNDGGKKFCLVGAGIAATCFMIGYNEMMHNWRISASLVPDHIVFDTRLIQPEWDEIDWDNFATRYLGGLTISSIFAKSAQCYTGVCKKWKDWKSDQTLTPAYHEEIQRRFRSYSTEKNNQ